MNLRDIIIQHHSTRTYYTTIDTTTELLLDGRVLLV